MPDSPVDVAVADEPGSRPINLLLMFAILALPVLFVWLLLLPGYARSTRTAAFVYAFGYPLLSIVALLAIALLER